ncbi:hypothetical protein K501DRAFT_312075 [Backusella circina FSU 941]|nr:hypothetical protein K501DRAFT_312075 [Backusella circina FSU 941]
MDKLSFEILSSIFTYIHYEQKKQCMVVYRSWAQVLKLGGLELETIMSPMMMEWKTVPYVNPPIAFIKEVKNTVGCRRLALYQFHNKAKLAKLYPNLRFLVFYPGCQASTHPAYTVHYCDEEIGQLIHWHYRLETLIDYDFTNELFVFLKSGVFHQLTTLILKPDYNFPEVLHIGDKLFDCLNNTPNLKILDINVGPITVTHLETVHSNVPHLDTLRFSRFSPTRASGVEPLQVHLKAVSLKNLDIDMGHNKCILSSELLHYILLKHPNLQEFSCTLNPNDGNRLRDFFPQLLHSTEKTLTKLKINVPKIASSMITSLRENVNSSLTTLELMLFDNPPNPRNYISLRNGQPVIRPGLVCPQSEDEEEKQQEVLDIVDLIEFTNITSLSLNNIPNIKFNIFRKLDKLQELRLKFLASLRTTTELNMAIKELPTSVKTLALTNIDVYLKEEDDEGIISGIRCLELLECRVKSELSDYLSNQLPRLKILVLHTDQTLFDLRLRHSHLSLVDIDIHLREPATYEEVLTPMKDSLHILFRVTIGNNTHIYRSPYSIAAHLNSRYHFGRRYFNVHDHAMYLLHKPTTRPLKENECYFHFQCENRYIFCILNMKIRVDLCVVCANFQPGIKIILKITSLTKGIYQRHMMNMH